MFKNRAVKRGVRRLDKRGPAQWFLRVDPDRLDLKSGCDCVLGQIYGSYVEGLRQLNVYRAGHYGFLFRGSRTKAWKEVIQARRDALEHQQLFSLESLYNEELTDEERKAYSEID